jgi:hypothetical protein
MTTRLRESVEEEDPSSMRRARGTSGEGQPVRIDLESIDPPTRHLISAS